MNLRLESGSNVFWDGEKPINLFGSGYTSVPNERKVKELVSHGINCFIDVVTLTARDEMFIKPNDQYEWRNGLPLLRNSFFSTMKEKAEMLKRHGAYYFPVIGSSNSRKPRGNQWENHIMHKNNGGPLGGKNGVAAMYSSPDAKKIYLDILNSSCARLRGIGNVAVILMWEAFSAWFAGRDFLADRIQRTFKTWEMPVGCGVWFREQMRYISYDRDFRPFGFVEGSSAAYPWYGGSARRNRFDGWVYPIVQGGFQLPGTIYRPGKPHLMYETMKPGNEKRNVIEIARMMTNNVRFCGNTSLPFQHIWEMNGGYLDEKKIADYNYEYVRKKTLAYASRLSDYLGKLSYINRVRFGCNVNQRSTLNKNLLDVFRKFKKEVANEI